MIRTARVLSLSVAVLLVSAVAAAPAAAQAASASPQAAESKPAAVTPASARALLGDWTVNAQGMQGATTFSMSFAAEDDAVVGTINAEDMAPEPIKVTDITAKGEQFVLSYSFYYSGNEGEMLVPTVVTVTPEGEGLKLLFDFADGSYFMPGTATRKK